MVTQAGKQIAKTIGQGRNPLRGKVAILDAPAGGTGATAGAYDTAAHRDAAIVSINQVIAVLRAIGLAS